MRATRPAPAIRLATSTGHARRAPALLALVASFALLAVSASATLAQAPASPAPPPSQLPVPTGPLFPEPSVDPLDQPSGAGAGVAAPDGIVGAWYSGTVSDVGYVDPNLGSYSSGGSEGLMYAFAPDGSWEYGWLLQSALYACEMRVMVYRTGVLSDSDPSTGMIQLDTQTAQMHSEDTCSESGNYDKQLPADDETLIWVRTSDEYGDELMLRAPDTDYSIFRPMATE
jgi:hypothetical protein